MKGTPLGWASVSVATTRLGFKGLAGTSALAYLLRTSETEEKTFITFAHVLAS